MRKSCMEVGGHLSTLATLLVFSGCFFVFQVVDFMRYFTTRLELLELI